MYPKESSFLKLKGCLFAQWCDNSGQNIFLSSWIFLQFIMSPFCCFHNAKKTCLSHSDISPSFLHLSSEYVWTSQCSLISNLVFSALPFSLVLLNILLVYLLLKYWLSKSMFCKTSHLLWMGCRNYSWLGGRQGQGFVTITHRLSSKGNIKARFWYHKRICKIHCWFPYLPRLQGNHLFSLW